LAPQAPVSLGRDLGDTLADKFGEFAQLLVQRIMVLQIVFTGVGLLRIALLAVTVLVKQFQQGWIDLLKMCKPLYQDRGRPQFDDIRITIRQGSDALS
jgi:hypothetical protein